MPTAGSATVVIPACCASDRNPFIAFTAAVSDTAGAKSRNGPNDGGSNITPVSWPSTTSYQPPSGALVVAVTPAVANAVALAYAMCPDAFSAKMLNGSKLTKHRHRAGLRVRDCGAERRQHPRVR